jgi:chemotaxis signal transduction protein
MAGYLNFTCGGMEFVVPSTDLRGVIEGPSVVHVPLAPPAVAGIFNWKGRLQTALDPAAFSGGPGCAAPRYALVLDHPEGDVALVAEAVGIIFHVEGDGGIQAGDDPLPPAPEAAFGAGRRMVAVRAFVEAVKAEAGGRGGFGPGA